MAVLAERHGGRLDLVASAHSLRLLIVVIVVPSGLQFAGLRGLDPTVPGPQAVNAGGLVALVALTLAGGVVMQRLRLVNAWMLGPLVAAFALTAGGIELSALPKWASSVAQLFIGVALGVRFTPAFLHTAPRWLASVGIGTLLMIALSAAYALAVARWVGLHPATVLLGTSPGGIAEMCITAKVLELGVPVVTAFHVTRLAAVVLLAGPLFRWRAAAS
jgi:membrane AbrB-like protein